MRCPAQIPSLSTNSPLHRQSTAPINRPPPSPMAVRMELGRVQTRHSTISRGIRFPSESAHPRLTERFLRTTLNPLQIHMLIGNTQSIFCFEDDANHIRSDRPPSSISLWNLAKSSKLLRMRAHSLESYSTPSPVITAPKDNIHSIHQLVGIP